MTKRAPRVPGEPADETEQSAEQMAEFVDVGVPAAVVAAPAPTSSKLPHPSTVDPTKITSSVLTSQGWICPAPKPAK